MGYLTILPQNLNSLRQNLHNRYPLKYWKTLQETTLLIQERYVFMFGRAQLMHGKHIRFSEPPALKDGRPSSGVGIARLTPFSAVRETGGAVAVGGRDRTSMIYFGQSRNGLTLGVQLDVGSRIPIATTAMGRAYIWALAPEERAALLRELRDHYGSRWPKMRDGIERSSEMVARHGFTISAGEWQNDVHAVGVALKLNDGTGPYAFNCGAPAFRFTEDRLVTDIGPRLVAMVRNIEAALGGVAPPSKKEEIKKAKAGGKVARVAEGIR